MARISIDIDEQACAEVMRRYRLLSKQDAVNFALNEPAAEAWFDVTHTARASGWIGNLDEMRDGRTPRP